MRNITAKSSTLLASRAGTDSFFPSTGVIPAQYQSVPLSERISRLVIKYQTLPEDLFFRLFWDTRALAHSKSIECLGSNTVRPILRLNVQILAPTHPKTFG